MRFSCPACSQLMECPDDHAGKKATCPKCGQKILIPSPASKPNAANKTVLGKLEASEGATSLPVQAVDEEPATNGTNIPTATPVAVIVVRVVGNAAIPRKFKTTDDHNKIMQVLAECLDGIDLEYDDSSGRIQGELRHSYSVASLITVEGQTRLRENEFIIDLASQSHFTTAAILFSVFAFPAGLIAAIVADSLAMSQAPQAIDFAIERMKQELRS